MASPYEVRYRTASFEQLRNLQPLRTVGYHLKTIFASLRRLGSSWFRYSRPPLGPDWWTSHVTGKYARGQFFSLFGPFDAHRYHSWQNRPISRSAASALKFSCLAHALTIAEMGDKGSPVFSTVWKRTLPPLSDAFFNADHDELIEIYIFLKQFGGPARICGEIIIFEAKNSNVKIIKKNVQRDVKWSEDSKSGLKIQIE